MTIYLDPASIHAEMMRRFPRMKRAVVTLDTSNAAHWATCLDTTDVPDGPADVDWNAAFIEDYHGLGIQMLRLSATTTEQE